MADDLEMERILGRLKRKYIEIVNAYKGRVYCRCFIDPEGQEGRTAKFPCHRRKGPPLDKCYVKGYRAKKVQK